MRILYSERDLETQGCCRWYPSIKIFFPQKTVNIKGHTFKKSLGIRNLRENTHEKMFWQASKAFPLHWHQDRPDWPPKQAEQMCHFRGGIERLPVPEIHSHLPLFQE